MEGTPVIATIGGYARVAPVRVAAALLVPAGLATASAVLIWAASAPIGAVRAPGPAPADALLALGAAVVCAGLLGLSSVGAALWLAALLRGQLTGRLARLATQLTPRIVQAAIGLSVGAAVVGGPLGGAALGQVAGPIHHPIAQSGARAARSPALPPGWSPDRPAARSIARVAPVVVVRGDTLWAIAARHLGRGASAAEVAAEWPRWHAANRSTIGPDPDLILPGQRLVAPLNGQRPGTPQHNREESS
jgi:nucleoid-associated protein YgaU